MRSSRVVTRKAVCFSSLKVREAFIFPVAVRGVCFSRTLLEGAGFFRPIGVVPRKSAAFVPRDESGGLLFLKS
ncbi:hypothetical protein D7024_05695 [Desulfofundulus salinus]|uniref:Uncharacterized protein n=1 Tax=Desulfofundulus salinus TaxID=2419843 RepID=A0A494WT12_9FIRM|nr:hypothetical protein D7024_05695 [Desulfofundulus salinum]